MAAVSPRERHLVEKAPMGAERKSFDGVTIAFHWVTVLIVLALLTTAAMHAQTHDDQTRVLMLRIHRSLGVTIWLVTVCRLLWRVMQAKLPPFPAHMTNLHRTCVTIAEYFLYALLVVQPLTGFGASITRGRSFTLFWGHVPPLMPRFPALENALFLAHRIGAWTFVILITGHAVAALVHHFVLRDEVLQRMAPLVPQRRRFDDIAPDAGEAQASSSG